MNNLCVCVVFVGGPSARLYCSAKFCPQVVKAYLLLSPGGSISKSVLDCQVFSTSGEGISTFVTRGVHMLKYTCLPRFCLLVVKAYMLYNLYEGFFSMLFCCCSVCSCCPCVIIHTKQQQQQQQQHEIMRRTRTTITKT